MNTISSSQFVTIASFNTGIEAHIVKGRLESEGIKVFLENESLINATGYTYLFGGIKLKVKKGDEKLARSILEEEE